MFSESDERPEFCNSGERRAARSALWSRSLGVFLVFSCLTAGGVQADVESDLNRRWRGAWVVLDVNTISGCNGSYTNNEVQGKLVSARVGERFEAGELALVHKVNLNRKRVELLVDLDEPVLRSRQDGPFTLYDESFCKVELRFELGGRSRQNPEEIESLLTSVLTRYVDEKAARGSDAWNRRAREPYPENYDQTLSEYDNWKIFQVNADVQAGIEESVDEAARLLDRLSDDPEYLEGFGKGVDDARDASWPSTCERLISVTEASWAKRAGKGRDATWRRGYDHGQRTVFHVQRARRLRRCFLPPPGF